MQTRKCELTVKLTELMKSTGYPIVQHNGQRRFGPPSDWVGPPPPRGCEVFIGKLRREIFEDELVPVFSRIGKIYELRLMMDFSGSNRGYAFVTYTKTEDAATAVRELDNYEIRPHHRIGVTISVDNRRLFVGNIPRSKTKEDLFNELSKRVADIVNVVLYENCYTPSQNRGFAFVEFTSHRAATMARRTLIPGCFKLWGRDIKVDWADPEPEIEEEKMQMVKILYVRNFDLKTTPQTIKAAFESAINKKVERLKKILDYAFIHFNEREDAELAMMKLQNVEIDGRRVEIKWARPVDREVYKLQKSVRGNAKFKRLNLSQTLLLYKQQLDRKEYAVSPHDEGIESRVHSPFNTPVGFHGQDISSAPAILDSICKGYMWTQPIYKYEKCVDPTGKETWIGFVELPSVGQPLFQCPRYLGPYRTMAYSSLQQAQYEAASLALNILKTLQMEVEQIAMLGQQNILYPSLVQPPSQPLINPQYYSLFPHHSLPVANPYF
ncbi:unnamed protein product [Leptosia nina]|uniref:RRM domain-containing protein n=1 Tax=Leptosia nina TaxID=320188 RepID=A0AAV1JZ54_9NEOP